MKHDQITHSPQSLCWWSVVRQPSVSWILESPSISPSIFSWVQSWYHFYCCSGILEKVESLWLLAIFHILLPPSLQVVIMLSRITIIIVSFAKFKAQRRQLMKLHFLYFSPSKVSLLPPIDSTACGYRHTELILFTSGWKRLLLAEAPRQVINAVTLYALIKAWVKHNYQLADLFNAMGHDVITKMMTGTMAFSFVIFVISFFMICIAAILYIPLLCHIQGNLKEYCCHKVDKR